MIDLNNSHGAEIVDLEKETPDRHSSAASSGGVQQQPMDDDDRWVVHYTSDWCVVYLR